MDKIPPLAASAFDKLTRAKEHIDQLDGDIGSWLRGSHRRRTEIYPEVREVCQYIRQVKRRPPGWPGLAGDAVNNLRASLDHLVWGLTLDHQGWAPRAPLEAGCRWRRVGFPVQLNPPDRWRHQSLWGVDPNLIGAFRDEQPKSAREPRLRGNELWILQELWNRDKHRSVFAIDSAVRPVRLPAEERVVRAIFGIRAGSYPEVDREVEGIEHWHTGPLIYGEEVEMLCLRFRNIPDPEILRPYLRQYYDFSADVLFDEGSPAFSEGVRPLLRRLYGRVEGILDRFVPKFNPGRKRVPTRRHTCPP